MARVLRRRTAFTLAEAMLALGLSVLVVLLAIQLAISALHSNQKSSDTVVASSLGSQKMEQFVYSLPAATKPAFWERTSYVNPYATDQLQLGNTTYDTAVFVEDATGGSKVVTVNVSWGSGAAGRVGEGRQVYTLSRLIYAH